MLDAIWSNQIEVAKFASSVNTSRHFVQYQSSFTMETREGNETRQVVAMETLLKTASNKLTGPYLKLIACRYNTSSSWNLHSLDSFSLSFLFHSGME